MRGLLGDLFGPAEETPLTSAQDIVQRAFAETDPRKRARLAKQALDLSADCADAYVLLAEQATTRKEALDLYQQALAAGERAIGPDAFQQSVGHFWGLLETRPYMRAREGLGTPSGPSAAGRRRPSTCKTCSGSTPATTRASAMTWPPGCWTWAGTTS